MRASHRHFIKASGLRWQSLMLLVPVPWARRVRAPPLLTILAPSERYARDHGRRHKSPADWARQGLFQVARWLPGREVGAVGDHGDAVIELLAAVRRHVGLVTRLRLDARLFDPPPARSSAARRSCVAAATRRSSPAWSGRCRWNRATGGPGGAPAP